jgi:biotin operon repressor
MNIFSDLFLLQRIDQLIRTRATGSPKSLAALLDISECSVYRLIERLKNMGLPIAYDKKSRTYYYVEPVKWNVEFIVGNEKVLSIKGGEKKFDFLSNLSFFDSTGHELCADCQSSIYSDKGNPGMLLPGSNPCG